MLLDHQKYSRASITTPRILNKTSITFRMLFLESPCSLPSSSDTLSHFAIESKKLIFRNKKLAHINLTIVAQNNIKTEYKQPNNPRPFHYFFLNDFVPSLYDCHIF